MAILSGINTKLRGSVGKWTFSQLKGQTVAKEKVDKKETPVRTQAQMLRRMKWANIVAMWQSFNGNDKPSFEGKDAKLSDFNAFMGANLASAGVYLPKDIADQGGGVVAPYQVTRGSLPTVSGSFNDGGVFVSGIAMGGTTVGASSTIGTLSQAIIDNNKGWRNGDQLSLFISRQTVDSNNVPRIETDTIEITLDTADESTLLGDIMDANTLGVVEGKLATGGTVTGGVAFIHSRKGVSRTLVSTQFLVVNNDTVLNAYNTEAAFDKATLSYGGINKEDFLTPDVTGDEVFGG